MLVYPHAMCCFFSRKGESLRGYDGVSVWQTGGFTPPCILTQLLAVKLLTVDTLRGFSGAE